MFRKNEKHLQSPLFSTLDELPAGMRARLEKSWAGTFRREVFERLNEEPFAVLYGEEYSRPNVPVNVLLGLEIMKAGKGWTDEELYEHFLFDLQVRYALGYEQLSEGYFGIRTLYEFRRNLSRYMQESGENLIEAAFEQVTDEQRQAHQVQTSELRIDSTQVASNIRQYSRIQLLIEVVQRVHRMLSEADQETYQELFAAYVHKKSSQILYSLKAEEYETHLERIGGVMAHLLEALAPAYEQTSAYAMLVRVFTEHFVWDENEQRPKQPKELAATSLQAPDDPDATFRRKQEKSYRGYVTNITETCAPDNEIQLILKVHTEPNVADDAQMLVEELPELLQRTEVKTIYTDGAYSSELLDELLDQHGIEQILTAIRGDKPVPDEFPSLVDFCFVLDDNGTPIAATCPQGQRFLIEPGRAEKRFIGRPDSQTCQACPFFASCPVRPRSGNTIPALYVSKRDIRIALKRQAIAAMPARANPRSAVEATVRSVKHPLHRGRLAVRGLFRVACQMIASAFMVNLRRIHKALGKPSALSHFSLFLWLLTLYRRLKPISLSIRPQIPCFALSPVLSFPDMFFYHPLCCTTFSQ